MCNNTKIDFKIFDGYRFLYVRDAIWCLFCSLHLMSVYSAHVVILVIEGAEEQDCLQPLDVDR